MIGPEIRVLQYFKGNIEKNIDPIVIMNGLRIQECINNTQAKTILNVSRSHEDRLHIWKELWKYILHLSLPTFLQVLDSSGYAKLSMELYAYSQVSNDEMGVIIGPHKHTCLESSDKFAQDLFLSLTINTHNNVFRNPCENLHELSQRYRKKFLAEQNNPKKMAIADKYAACLCAEIDSHTMINIGKFKTHCLFKELENILTKTSNTNVTEVAFKSRLAIAYLTAEETESGEELLKGARAASYHIGHCVQLENMMYIQLLYFLCQFERNPTDDLRNTILKLADISLQTVEKEREVARNFWKRMFLLRMVYCLLGISNRCDLILRCPVRKIHVNKAKSLMAEIDQIWDGIESRRKMFYYVARARISEIASQETMMKSFISADQEKTKGIALGHIEVAIHQIHKAIGLGLEGKFGETKSLHIYITNLKRQKQEIYFMDTLMPNRSGQEHSDMSCVSARFRRPEIHTTTHGLEEKTVQPSESTEHDEHMAIEHEEIYKPSKLENEYKCVDSEYTSDKIN